jgi:hypothetical protein
MALPCEDVGRQARCCARPDPAGLTSSPTALAQAAQQDNTYRRSERARVAPRIVYNPYLYQTPKITGARLYVGMRYQAAVPKAPAEKPAEPTPRERALLGTPVINPQQIAEREARRAAGESTGASAGPAGASTGSETASGSGKGRRGSTPQPQQPVRKSARSTRSSMAAAAAAGASTGSAAAASPAPTPSAAGAAGSGKVTPPAQPSPLHHHHSRTRTPCIPILYAAPTRLTW